MRRSPVRWAALAASSIAAAAAVGLSATAAASAMGAVAVTETTGSQTLVDAPQPAPTVVSAAHVGAGEAVHVDDTTAYQTMSGFGAALTDASASLLWDLPAAERHRVLVSLFSPTQGIGLSILRIPMGASDFSTSWYTYDDMPPGATDPTLSHFSVSHDQAYILPLLSEIRAINPAVRILATPWTAPAWMKSNQSLIGGYLNGQWTAAYAAYFVKFLQAYAAAGVPVNAISLQNEPETWPVDYPGMVVNAADASNFISELEAELVSAHLSPAIIGYDGNWDDPGYATTELTDASARRSITGVGFHCYAGDPSAMTALRDSFPGAAMWITECSGGGWSTNFATNLDWDSHNLLVGGPDNWASDVLFWNLALDPTGGPRIGGCTDCRGILTINPTNGVVTTNIEYDLLTQVAPYVRPGAVRVSATTYGAGDLETVAYRNRDGGHTLVIANTGPVSRTAAVTWSTYGFTETVPANSMVTLRW